MSKEDLEEEFAGWKLPDLISQVTKDGLFIDPESDAISVYHAAHKFYMKKKKPIPTPPNSRNSTSSQGQRRSLPRPARRPSAETNDKRKSRRVSNVPGSKEPTQTQNQTTLPKSTAGTGSNFESSMSVERASVKRKTKKQGGNDDDIINFLLDQVGEDVDDISLYSKTTSQPGLGPGPANSVPGTVSNATGPKSLKQALGKPASSKMQPVSPVMTSQFEIRTQNLHQVPTRRDLQRLRTERNKHRYSGGINDLGIYDPELALEDAARYAYSTARPDVNAAKDYAKRFHPIDYDGEPYYICNTSTGRLCFPDSFICDIFEEGNESDLATFGVGISLYFKWLKWLGWIYFVLTLLSLPQLFLNMAGAAGNRDYSSFQSFVFISSAGNLVDDSLTLIETNATDEVNYVPIGEAFPNSSLVLPGFSCDGEPCAFSRETVFRMYVSTDILIVLVLLFGSLFLRTFVVLEYSLLEKYFRKIEQYTLELVNLPKETSEKQLTEYFRAHLGADIHDIVVAKNNGNIINLYKDRGNLVAEMWHIIGVAKQIVEDHFQQRKELDILNIDAYNDKITQMIEDLNVKKAQIAEQFDYAYAQYIALDEKRKRCKLGEDVVSAFITFETAEAYNRALETMKKRRVCSGHHPNTRGRSEVQTLASPDLPLFIDTKLIGKPAPPPTTIIWENLEFSNTSRLLRKSFTFVVALLLLAISFAIAFITQSFRVELASSSRNQTLALFCDSLDSSLFASSISRGISEVSPEVLRLLQASSVPTSAPTVDPETLLKCQCSLLSFTEAAVAIIEKSNECHDFWSDLAPTYIFTSFASLIIASVSVAMNLLTQSLASLEKHRSVQTQELSIGSRLFLAQFINVGLALLLVNANFVIDLKFIGHGEYSDFSGEWYANVGSQIFVTVFISTFTPHMTELGYFCVQKAKQIFSTPKVQAQMNKLYLGEEFVLSYRYAQQLTSISVTMVYGPGMPLFYPLAVVNFALYYWTDKFLFLRFYQTPPDFGDSLAKFASRIMLILVPVHCAFAVYMYTAPGLFLISSEAIIGNQTGLEFVGTIVDRFTLGETLPLTLIMLLGFGIIIFDSFVVMNSSYYQHERGRIDETDKDFENVTKGKETGKFSSQLTTYNILENRNYLSAFGISPIFAREHQGVESLFTAENEMLLPKLPDEIRERENPYEDHTAQIQ